MVSRINLEFIYTKYGNFQDLTHSHLGYCPYHRSQRGPHTVVLTKCGVSPHKMYNFALQYDY